MIISLQKESGDLKDTDGRFTVERTGFYTPFLLAGAAVSAVALGLMSLLMPDSDACMYIGFQIIYGIGRGMSMSTVSPSASTPHCLLVSSCPL